MNYSFETYVSPHGKHAILLLQRLFRKMLALYSENHAKHTNTFCEQSIGFTMSVLEHVAQKWTTGLLRHVQTGKTDYKNVFFQLDHVASVHELPLPYMVAVVSIFWPFAQTFLQHSSLELTNFLRHFPADSYLKCSCTKNTHSFTVYQHWDMRLRQWRNYKCIYQQQNDFKFIEICDEYICTSSKHK